MSAMSSDEQDPLSRLLQPLTDATWDGDEHRRQLLHELERSPRRRSRGALLLSALAGGVIAAMLLAATGGARFLQRLFGFEVVDVQRDARGNIERVTVHTDDNKTLQMRPWTDASELEEPVPVTLRKHGGGDVHVLVLRDRDLSLLPRYVQEGASQTNSGTSSGSMATGAKYTVREVPCPWTIAVAADAVTLHAVAGGTTVELPRIATAPGSLARYGNDRALLDVVDDRPDSPTRK